MTDTIISLGGFTFSGWGVPELVNGGGRQRLAVHRLIGGGRVVDALGWDPDQIRFSGRLRGSTASTSARLLETLARVGVPVVFSYWSSRYQVVVSRCRWRFERYYEMSYDLTLEVLADLTQDAWQAPTSTVDDLINSDLALLTSAVSQTSALVGSPARIATAQAQVGVLQDATPTAVAPLGSAVAASQSTSLSLQNSLDAGLPAAPAGGVSAGADPAQLAARLSTQAGDYQQLASAVQSSAILTRMQVNLATVGQ